MTRGKRKKKASGRRDGAANALFMAAWTFTGAAVLGALERYLWLGALAREAGLHLALLATLAAGFALARRAWVALASLTALAGLFALPLVPLYRPTRPTPDAGPSLRVATADLNGAALSSDALHSWLARTRPAAAALSGLKETRSLGDHLGSYRVVRSPTDLHAALLVQSELAKTQEAGHGPPMASVRAGACQVRVLAIDLPPLAAYLASDARRRTIARLRALPHVARSVWLGQLGSRPDAHDLVGLLEAHELRDGRHGHGRFATAPAAWRALGFPLSHVLVHGWIRVRDLSLGAPLASGGQRAVHGTIELTEPRCRVRRNFQHE